MALYGAPAWADALSDKNISQLRRPQRVMAQRVIRGYRTIGSEAACALAGTLPWDLEAQILASLFVWRKEALARDLWPAPQEIRAQREILHQAAVERWSARLERPSAGVRTIEAIRPVLKNG
ncbi:uncharacterized protein LOC125234861 [Leguminivora glycinivorella]|uniref:uncharacterized protein LOC125234861 n=1 Tax=Leguminivora glycinivorella TaxID=1035111 RepID=UPI00200CB01C|nr:uncharacterized protein LOC125234861 [Leguminivora glycinivorella]